LRRIQSALLMAVSASAVLLALTSAQPAQAFPPFKDKEKKPCTFCHLKPEGGARNYRGLYYKAHNLTFTEFDDAAEAKKAGVEVAADPDPTVKPTSWTAPKTVEAPKPEEKPVPADQPLEAKMTVAQAKVKVAATEKALKLKPKDPAAKKAHAASLADLGHSTMLDQSIPPRVRYPEALKHLRKAKTLDPKNKLALDDIKLIEEAYKSMGRPVPK
jgi:hypothetical protein